MLRILSKVEYRYTRPLQQVLQMKRRSHRRYRRIALYVQRPGIPRPRRRYRVKGGICSNIHAPHGFLPFTQTQCSLYYLLPCLKRFPLPRNLLVVCAGLVGFVLTLEACLSGCDFVLEQASLKAAAEHALIVSFPGVSIVHGGARGWV
jgi:hypothetical protein